LKPGLVSELLNTVAELPAAAAIRHQRSCAGKSMSPRAARR